MKKDFRITNVHVICDGWKLKDGQNSLMKTDQDDIFYIQLEKTEFEYEEGDIVETVKINPRYEDVEVNFSQEDLLAFKHWEDELYTKRLSEEARTKQKSHANEDQCNFIIEFQAKNKEDGKFF